MNGSQVRFVAGLAVLLLLSSLVPAKSDEFDHVRVGSTFSQSDAPIFIGLAKGYFNEAGLDVELIPFDTAASMFEPMGAGQIDAGAGAPTAGLFNAVRRGADVKFVADESTSAPGYGVISILVRRALIASGRVTTFADLRGLRFAQAGRGTAAFATMSAALRRGGLTPGDVREVFLPSRDQVLALARGQIDAAATIEPFATQALLSEVAVKFSSSDVLLPNGTNSAMYYGGPFSRNRRDVATRFMIAYIRAMRFYAGALRNGRLAGLNAPEVISILTKYTDLKDASIFHAMTPNSVDVNGRINLPSLNDNLAAFQQAGLVPADVALGPAMDPSFVDAALKILGTYRR